MKYSVFYNCVTVIEIDKLQKSTFFAKKNWKGLPIGVHD